MTEQDEMNDNFSGINDLIMRVDRTCEKVHTKSGGLCGLGTDCPFHAAFEVNTLFGCRLSGLKHIMKKRERRKEKED